MAATNQPVSAGDLPEPFVATAELAENMTEAQRIAQEIWSVYTEKQVEDGVQDPDPFNIMPALADLQQNIIEHPETVVETAVDLWGRQAMLWTNMIAEMAGVEPKPIKGLENADKDRRFKDDAWESNALFTYLKQSYLVGSSLMRDTIKRADADLPKEERDKLEFFTDRFVEALSPSNMFAMNPQVLEATAEEHGANIVRGMKQMLHDLKRGDGDLLISQTDMDAFEVGENIAVTPGKVVFQNDLLQLLQYEPTTKQVYERPILFAPPWINKFYILDLNEKKSLIRWLVSEGFTVFVISWRNPEPNGIERDFKDYITEGFYQALDKVLEETGQEDANVVGYCIGGTMLFTALAHMAREGDKRAHTATFFTAQADFEKAGDLKVFVDDKSLEQMEDKAERQGGVLDASEMSQAFNMLRGNELIWNYVVSNYYLGKEPTAFDLLYWNADSTRMPAKCHIAYLRDFYRDNALAAGELALFGDEPLDLSKVKLPVYSVSAREDHIAPAESVFRSMKLLGSTVRFIVGGSGHIAGVVNPYDPEKTKYQYWSSRTAKAKWPDTVEEWIDDAKETAGTWWPDWSKWLSERSGKKVKARKPGAKLGTIEDAPGSYVKVRSDNPVDDD